jgi:hypothetical protein
MCKDTGHKIYIGSGCQGGEPYVIFGESSMAPYMLTVLTTKFRPSKPRVQEEYTTSFMHIVDTNKVPQVVLQFLWIGTHLGGKWNQRAT